LVRKIAAILDLSWVHAELAPHYPDNGRPSIDPELMIRMLIIGYVFAIRSERALCRDVQVNLAYRWFCGLSIEDKIPDHSAFSRARNERFRDSDIFRRVFEHMVETCIAAGLVGGEGFAVDASLIVADSNKQRSIPGAEWTKERAAKDASRAVKEYLATLDDAAFGVASEVTPKFVSPSDPAAQWTGAMRGLAFFAYADNYLVDVKCGVIVDRQAEVGAAKTMIERTEERLGLKPQRLSGVRREKHAHTFLRVLSKLFRTRDRAVAEQHRAVERRRHNQPIKLGCREQRIVNRKSATVREPFECRRKRCNRPPGASGIERRTKFWKASYLADHEPAQLQDPGSQNDFELSDGIADQVAL
jgi:transposase